MSYCEVLVFGDGYSNKSLICGKNIPCDEHDPKDYCWEEVFKENALIGYPGRMDKCGKKKPCREHNT